MSDQKTQTSDIAEAKGDAQSSISYEYLISFNKKMAVLHLVQGVLMVLAGGWLPIDIPIYTFYNTYNFIPPDIVEIVPTPEVLFTLTNVGALVGSFLLMSALAHSLIAWPLKKTYVKNLKKHINPIRWFEYAFSSSVMIFLISVFFGVYDFWLLVGMFVLNALMNMFGWMMEKINQRTEKTDWSAYILGVVAGIVPWIVIVAYFFSVSVAGNAGEIPGFVYAILVVEFILFNTFAINMVLQYKVVVKWKDYIYEERLY